MERLAQLFRPWGPYSLAALGAALVGYGLVSGLLLIRGHGRPFVRPFFMSAFVTALLVFAVAALERTLIAERHDVLKAPVVLIVIIYGVALVRRAWTRQLAKRSFRSFLVVCVTSTALPWVPGFIGLANNLQEVQTRIATPTTSELTRQAIAASPAVANPWTPLVAAAVASAFLAMAMVLLLYRHAKKQ